MQGEEFGVDSGYAMEQCFGLGKRMLCFPQKPEKQERLEQGGSEQYQTLVGGISGADGGRRSGSTLDQFSLLCKSEEMWRPPVAECACRDVGDQDLG